MSSANDAIRAMAEVEDNLTDLHNGLLAKVLLQRAPPQKGKSSSATDASKPQRTPWASFLDDLSLLCDFRKGGESVRGIAVQAADERNVFWMASNVSTSKDIKLAETHLRWMLDELYNSSRDGLNSNDVAKKISEKSIELANDKVKNYLNRLSREIKPSEERQGSPEWKQVSELAAEVYSNIVSLASDRTDLCHRAFQFRKSSCFRDLDSLAQNNIMSAHIIHYLGRLGSWTKAARAVASKAERFKDILSRRDVLVLAVNSGLCKSINTDGDIRTIILRAIPGFRAQDALDIIEQKSARFLDKLKGRKQVPKVHAEAALLHHFHINDFLFVRGECYVGCSKPSCYACAIYFDILGAQERQRHGNAWLQWGPPGKLTDGAEIVRKMAERVIDDVRQQLQNNVLGGKRTFDSTTGITQRIAALLQ